MQNFITALKAEHIKKKGTGIYLSAVLFALVSPLIIAITKIAMNEPRGAGLPYNYFTDFIKDCLDPFAGFFFPLFIIITVSRIVQLDHKYGGWQLMETQPLRKTTIYFSKFTVVLLSNLIAIATVIITGFLFSWIVSFIIDVPKEASFSFEAGEIAMIIARLFLAALFFTTFQYMLSVLMPSFIWSILIGVFLLLLYLFLMAFNVTPDWYPIAFFGKLSAYHDGSDLGYWITYSELLSVLLSAIALYIGFEWYRHKNLKAAFFSKGSRIVKLIGVVAVLGGLTAYTLLPNTMQAHGKTVISGTIDSDAKFNTVYVTDFFINDTIAVIPVKDNKFSYTIDKDIPLDYYQLAFDEKYKTEMVLGDKDSAYVALKFYNNSANAVITGTRLPETRYKAEKDNSWSMVEYYLEDNLMLDNPEYITKELVSEWKKAMATSSKFKTADNYVPREDFINNTKKIISIKYLNLWNTFVKKRTALFPGEKTPETEDIKEIKATVPLNDEGMLSTQDYFNYVVGQMIAKNKEDLDDNTKSLRAIAKLPSGTFRDKMLYWQLDKSLKETAMTTERATLLAEYGNKFSNRKYLDITINKDKTITRLSKGMSAPLFDATSIDNKQFNLADLKGKFVVIDVWATWCKPCKEQSQHFERLALKYKKENIQFVAISTDRKIDSWFVEAKTKSKSVLQLHINNDAQFSKDYNVQFIPRFILVDPQGNLVNSSLMYPEYPDFEKEVRAALGLPEQK